MIVYYTSHLVKNMHNYLIKETIHIQVNLVYKVCLMNWTLCNELCAPKGCLSWSAGFTDNKSWRSHGEKSKN